LGPRGGGDDGKEAEGLDGELVKCWRPSVSQSVKQINGSGKRLMHLIAVVNKRQAEI